MSDFIQDAITAAGVTLQRTLIQADLYDCTLTSPDHTMQRKIAMKPDHDAPTLGGLLYHYALIAQQLEEIDDVLEWADDNGHDLSDPKTLSKFQQMVTDKDDLHRLLGDPAYRDLMSGLAISQAISNARPG